MWHLYDIQMGYNTKVQKTKPQKFYLISFIFTLLKTIEIFYRI